MAAIINLYIDAGRYMENGDALLTCTVMPLAQVHTHKMCMCLRGFICERQILIQPLDHLVQFIRASCSMRREKSGSRGCPLP